MKMAAPPRCRSAKSSIAASAFLLSRFLLGSSAGRLTERARQRTSDSHALPLAAAQLVLADRTWCIHTPLAQEGLSISITGIPTPQFPYHPPDSIRLTTFDHLNRSRSFEGRVGSLEPGTDLGGRNKIRGSCEQTRQLSQISLIRSLGRLARQPSGNGSTRSSHKSRKYVQSQICLPTELLDIGSRQDFPGGGRLHFSPGGSYFELKRVPGGSWAQRGVPQ